MAPVEAWAPASASAASAAPKAEAAAAAWAAESASAALARSMGVSSSESAMPILSAAADVEGRRARLLQGGETARSCTPRDVPYDR